MANVKVQAKNIMTIPPLGYISWFSENQEIYQEYVEGNIVSVPTYVADALDCERQEQLAEEVMVEETEEEKEALTMDELMAIDGIGKKRAEEILETYTYRTDLSMDMSNDAFQIEVSDAIMEQLQEQYGAVDFEEPLKKNDNQESEMND